MRPPGHLGPCRRSVQTLIMRVSRAGVKRAGSCLPGQLGLGTFCTLNFETGGLASENKPSAAWSYFTFSMQCWSLFFSGTENVLDRKQFEWWASVLLSAAQDLGSDCTCFRGKLGNQAVHDPLSDSWLMLYWALRLGRSKTCGTNMI